MGKIAKQQASQKFILKVNSSRLRRAKWNITLPLSEARKNDEIISLNSSQALRWIEDLDGRENSDAVIRRIKSEIRILKKQENTLANRREIGKLYNALDREQFKQDYMCLIIDREKDLYRACRGFYINGIKYVRLLGTNGGVKNETIVFVSERVAPILRERIDNGRDKRVKLIPAKLEAYRALTCSGSIPVSMPNGILVVNDCETEFVENIVSLNDESSIEPEMVYIKNANIKLNESDGYGLMLPSLAKRWSEDLDLDYLVSGVNTRFSWEKGMVFCYDFIDFADKIAKNHIVKDAWGNDVDITKVELILTTSMLKLWNCYDSLDHYLTCCKKNKYTFGIAKNCPSELESERNLNYQFIQSYDLNDDQVSDLIQPTINEIHDIVSGDYRKAILFLKGMYLNDINIKNIDNDFAKAIMIDRRIFDDPFIKNRIYQMIKKRIVEAKVGVIKVHGNYSVASGDPFSLCQHIFGMEVTGLLKPGEIYNKFWVDDGAESIACFRAPMTCHNNIRLMNVTHNNEIDYWYRYMNACTIFNSWDSAAHALNGMDKDGDLVLLTDDSVLVKNIKPTPTIMCAQRKADKIDVTEDDLICSNIASFGDDIGKTTNWITTMFDVQAQFPKESIEYEILDYRIKCGQLYQQNAIDKAKGIICKPMPRGWYDRGHHKLPEAPTEHDIYKRDLNLRILADKKPYFMRYIYPRLMTQYNDYIRNTETKCIREFRITVDDLLHKKTSDLSEREIEFLKYYRQRMPVGTHPCVMNRICMRIEKEFDGYQLTKCLSDGFNYSIMKSDVGYTELQLSAITKLYTQYNKRLQEYMQMTRRDRVDEDESSSNRSVMVNTFKEECHKICSNSKQMCNILLDICYKKNGTKQFAWDICGDDIIDNLLASNSMRISFPSIDDNGDIAFCGRKFSMKELVMA